MSSHYDDPLYNYPAYWQKRQYEHQSEIMALNMLLDHTKFSTCVDIGAGFGRLIPFLHHYCQRLILIEPSQKQRRLAAHFLKSQLIHYSIIPGSAQSTGLKNRICDLAVLVRVAHHLPRLKKVFHEVHRILKPNGYFIFEFANSSNFKARFTKIFQADSISLTPVQRKGKTNPHANSIPFLNHHPASVLYDLKNSGFTPKRLLSVSNLRSFWIKKILPLSWMLTLEKYMQPLLAKFYFGPSIFVLSQKN